MDELGLLKKVGVFNMAGTFNDPLVWDLSEGRNIGAVNWTLGLDPESTMPEIRSSWPNTKPSSRYACHRV